MGYVVNITCDKCEDGYICEDMTLTKPMAINILRKKGWQVGKTGWFCPNCRSRRRKGGPINE